MHLKLLTAFAVAAGSMSAAAFGQGRPPADSPPPGFAGQQYVDSRGCLYARAGMGANENWVARIDRDRKPICGQTPTRTQMAEALALLAAPDPVMPPAANAAPAAPARAPAAVTAVAPAPAPVAPPAAQQPRPAAAAAASAAAPVAPPPAAPRASTDGCPSHAPWGRYFDLRRGGRTLICSNSLDRLDQLQGSTATGTAPGSATATASVSPMMAMAQAIALPAAPSQAQLEAEQKARALRARLVEDEALSKPPPGYKSAWDDGRLNPMRGVRTEAGERQMERVWVPGSPMKAQPSELPPSPVVGQMPAMTGSHAAPAKGSQVQGTRVQVGSFADAANAQTVAARIQAMGLPVSLGQAQVRGKSVQVVSAGPFASKAEASAAQAALRGAGFTDSILR